MEVRRHQENLTLKGLKTRTSFKSVRGTLVAQPCFKHLGALLWFALYLAGQVLGTQLPGSLWSTTLQLTVLNSC